MREVLWSPLELTTVLIREERTFSMVMRGQDWGVIGIASVIQGIRTVSEVLVVV